ncbi:MAG: type II toxin-antitoxin system VapC family toxin [Anaerolineae bacterium]
MAVADTHTAVWYLSSDNRLSTKARDFINNAIELGNTIGISAVTLVEMVYLVEKGRIAPNQFTQLARELENADSMFVELPVTMQTARSLSAVSAEQIPDMPDRIIAAAALQHDIPIISRDGRIVHSDMETIW